MTAKTNSWILILGFLLAGALQAADNAANEAALRKAIDARSAEEKARDGARHPYETLVFFQVAPGMTVAEALPGGGWYTNILANYLGGDGALYGINYPQRMWAMFPNATKEWIAKHEARTAQFPGMVSGFTDNGIKTAAFTFNTIPPELAGTVDRVLMIRITSIALKARRAPSARRWQQCAVCSRTTAWLAWFSTGLLPQMPNRVPTVAVAILRRRMSSWLSKMPASNW